MHFNELIRSDKLFVWWSWNDEEFIWKPIVPKPNRVNVNLNCEEMDNLGYKEGSTKPKPAAGKRRMSRARASVVENEALPLSLTPRYFNCLIR